LLIDTAQAVCLKVYQQLLSLAVEAKSRQMEQIRYGILEAKCQEEGQLRNKYTLMNELYFVYGFSTWMMKFSNWQL